MSSEKSFPPSDLKREELRQGGVVPYSAELTSVGVIAGAVFGLWWFLAGAGGAIVHLLELSFRGGAFHSEGSPASEGVVLALRKSVELFFVGAFQLGLPVVVVGLAVHLWQCGFRFQFIRVRRLRRRRGDLRIGVRVTAALCFLGTVFLCVATPLQGVMANDWSGAIRDVLWGGGAGGGAGGGQMLAPTLRTALLASAGVAGVIGVFSFIVARIRFFRVHSMSREEIEAEAREAEMRPETRQAVRGGYSQGGGDE